jgi:hypothetical protein
MCVHVCLLQILNIFRNWRFAWKFKTRISLSSILENFQLHCTATWNTRQSGLRSDCNFPRSKSEAFYFESWSFRSHEGIHLRQSRCR